MECPFIPSLSALPFLGVGFSAFWRVNDTSDDAEDDAAVIVVSCECVFFFGARHLLCNLVYAEDIEGSGEQLQFLRGSFYVPDAVLPGQTLFCDVEWEGDFLTSNFVSPTTRMTLRHAVPFGLRSRISIFVLPFFALFRLCGCFRKDQFRKNKDYYFLAIFVLLVNLSWVGAVIFNAIIFGTSDNDLNVWGSSVHHPFVPILFYVIFVLSFGVSPILTFLPFCERTGMFDINDIKKRQLQALFSREEIANAFQLASACGSRVHHTGDTAQGNRDQGVSAMGSDRVLTTLQELRPPQAITTVPRARTQSQQFPQARFHASRSATPDQKSGKGSKRPVETIVTED